jgi:hypothetical protein
MTNPGDAVLDEQVEIAPGVTKRLGDCTADDLKAAAALAREAAQEDR